MSKTRNPDALIRIEDAIKVLCWETCCPGVCCPDGYCTKMWDEFEDVERVDAVPVRHGYWKMVTMSEATGYDPGLSGDDPPYGHVCSVCKREARLNEEGEQILSNFCPDCGTRMDGKGGDT